MEMEMEMEAEIQMGTGMAFRSNVRRRFTFAGQALVLRPYGPAHTAV
jgi:hypothetical protein